MRFKRPRGSVFALAFLIIFSYSVATVFGQNAAFALSPESAVTYVVKSGDTLSALARSFHTTVGKLAKWNTLSNPNFIYVGEQLQVPRTVSGLPTSAKAMTFTLTAYTAGYESTGKYPGEPGYDITATGQRAIQGLSIAVDPNVIPYGTPVYIPGVGVRIADDTGGAIVGNRIDVFYNDVQTALDFGVKRDTTVYLLHKKDIAYRGDLPILRPNLVKQPVAHLTQKWVRPTRASTKATFTPLSTKVAAGVAQLQILPENTEQSIAGTTVQPAISPEETDVLSEFDLTMERKVWIPMLRNFAR